jgi:glycosyltransferase involved in cell wall biosynthesis
MCEDYIRQNSLDSYFEFRKEVMNDKLPDFYRSLDLFVLPSYWEAFGCVYTEAYSCGVPFIGVKGQGISEIIPKEDADKWLIDKGDDATLAQLIKRNMIGEQANQKLSISVDADSLITEYLQNIK